MTVKRARMPIKLSFGYSSSFNTHASKVHVRGKPVRISERSLVLRKLG